MNKTHNYKEELRGVFLKATPARLAVLSLLERENKPVDVSVMIQYLNKKDIKTHPATVFRIVNKFTQKGLLKTVQLNEGKFRYEYASKKDHHHLLCERCGRIEDISDCSIGSLEKEIMQKKKFFVRRHSLEFFGICKQCQH